MVKPIHSHMQHPTDLNTAPPPACTVSLSFKLLLQQLPAPSAVGRGLPKALQLRLLSTDADVRQAAEADAKRVCAACPRRCSCGCSRRTPTCARPRNSRGGRRQACAL